METRLQAFGYLNDKFSWSYSKIKLSTTYDQPHLGVGRMHWIHFFLITWIKDLCVKQDYKRKKLLTYSLEQDYTILRLKVQPKAPRRGLKNYLHPRLTSPF